jgi:tricorn protease-like protein
LFRGALLSIRYIPLLLFDPATSSLASLFPIMQASATPLHTLQSHNEEVSRLLFSPNGKTLAAHDDLTLTLWDITTGLILHKLEEAEDMYFQMAFSADSKYIAAASGEGNARVWDVRTGELRHVCSVEDERMLSLAFSPDSKLLATGSEILRVWDAETGELLHTLLDPGTHSLSITAMMERHEHIAEISTVTFSHDGKLLVSGCPDTSTVSIWSTESWTLQHTIRGYTALFSPDWKYAVVPSDEYTTMQIYNMNTWQLQSTLETQDKDQHIFPSTFSPDSKVLATYSGREITLWDINSGKSIETFTDLTRKVSTPVFSPDGKMLIAGARKCGLRVWNVESGDCLLVLEPEAGARDLWSSDWIRGGPPAFEVMFCDGGAKVAIAFPDGSVRIWDVKWEFT